MLMSRLNNLSEKCSMSFDGTSVSKVLPNSGLCDTTQYKTDASDATDSSDDVGDDDVFDEGEGDVPGVKVSMAKLRECD